MTREEQFVALKARIAVLERKLGDNNEAIARSKAARNRSDRGERGGEPTINDPDTAALEWHRHQILNELTDLASDVLIPLIFKSPRKS